MALLLMIVPAMLGNFVVVEGLVTAGDAARTAADIMASEGLFRAGVASLLVVILLDVIVAWVLYRFFQPVAAGLSALAAAFRLVYAGVFTVAVAGFGYAFDSVAAVLVGDSAPVIAGFTFLGEVLLAVWLVVWSRRQRCVAGRDEEGHT